MRSSNCDRPLIESVCNSANKSQRPLVSCSADTPGSPSRLAITARPWLPSTVMPIQARMRSGSASGFSRTV